MSDTYVHIVSRVERVARAKARGRSIRGAPIATTPLSPPNNTAAAAVNDIGDTFNNITNQSNDYPYHENNHGDHYLDDDMEDVGRSANENEPLIGERLEESDSKRSVRWRSSAIAIHGRQVSSPIVETRLDEMMTPKSSPACLYASTKRLGNAASSSSSSSPSLAMDPSAVAEEVPEWMISSESKEVKDDSNNNDNNDDNDNNEGYGELKAGATTLGGSSNQHFGVADMV
jgi:hypothetical protein